MTWKWIERFWCSVAGVVNGICAPRDKGVDILILSRVPCVHA